MKKGVIGVLSTLLGVGIGSAAVGKLMGKKVNDWHSLSDRHLALFLLMNQWVKVKQEGKNLSLYFENNGYKKIAVYGMSYVGETLVDELSGSNVEIAYAIDKNADSIYADIEVVTPEEELQDVDAIIVTAITFFDEVEEMLSEKVECPVISLDDILYEI